MGNYFFPCLVRGKKAPGNKKGERVNQHINTIPRIESHYCRASTEYLEADLSIRKMYALYYEWFKDKSVEGYVENEKGISGRNES